MFIWLEDAPSITANDSDDNNTRVCDLIDNIITCERENGMEVPIYEIKKILRLNPGQIFCTGTRSPVEDESQVVCRFNIPFITTNETMVLRPISPDEQTTDHDQEAYRQKNKRIREYWNRNSETLVASNTTFEEFLGINDITNVEEGQGPKKKLSDEAYHRLLSTLNAKQCLILAHNHHIRYNKDEYIVRYFDTSAAPDSNNAFSLMQLLVTGGDGAGESMLINVLYQSFKREFDETETAIWKY
ncbi:hypothetical protein [Parasitella parasitica]|uniref:Uncharacterized protein n=1 Tax=Parasitella parasitica TaxID=35722 RepID=A0A0B7NAF3_9FUNG|nr:hypothetical protein [Parasitella parasitica]